MKTGELDNDKSSQIFTIVGDKKNDQSATIVSVSSLNDDLLLLLELGALQKVLDLSRNYNFFNVHGAVLYVAISTRQFRYAEEVLIDLAIGPFLNRDQEFIMRALFIISEIENHSVDYMTSQLLKQYEKPPTFIKWQKSLLSTDSMVDRLSQLKKLTIIIQKNIAKYGDLNSVIISTPQEIINNYKNFNEYKADFFKTKSVIEDQQINDLIFHQALANIESYIDNPQEQYRDTLLKTDFDYINKSLSQDAVRELALRCRLYDLHPILSVKYYESGRFDDALSVLHELVAQSDLFSKERGFKIELAKKSICELMINLLAKTEQEARDEFGPLILLKLPKIYHQDVIRACTDGVCRIEIDLSEIKDNFKALETYKVVLKEDIHTNPGQDLRTIIKSLQ